MHHYEFELTNPRKVEVVTFRSGFVSEKNFMPNFFSCPVWLMNMSICFFGLSDREGVVVVEGAVHSHNEMKIINQHFLYTHDWKVK